MQPDRTNAASKDVTVSQAIGVLAATIVARLDPIEWQDAWMALGMLVDKFAAAPLATFPANIRDTDVYRPQTGLVINTHPGQGAIKP